MNKKILPTQKELINIFDYCSTTGHLFWKIRPSQATKVGAFAGCITNGYIVISIKGTAYKAHRLIWKMIYGDDPEVIDHINRNGLDNRLSNLRSVSIEINGKNRKKNKNNVTGHTGIFFIQSRNKYQSTISINKKRLFLGNFNSIDEAIEVREKYKKEAGYL